MHFITHTSASVSQSNSTIIGGVDFDLKASRRNKKKKKKKKTTSKLLTDGTHGIINDTLSTNYANTENEHSSQVRFVSVVFYFCIYQLNDFTFLCKITFHFYDGNLLKWLHRSDER